MLCDFAEGATVREVIVVVSFVNVVVLSVASPRRQRLLSIHCISDPPFRSVLVADD
jgi:hypothetical protein